MIIWVLRSGKSPFTIPRWCMVVWYIYLHLPQRSKCKYSIHGSSGIGKSTTFLWAMASIATLDYQRVSELVGDGWWWLVLRNLKHKIYFSKWLSVFCLDKVYHQPVKLCFFRKTDFPVIYAMAIEHGHWKFADLPIQNSDFPYLCKRLPEDFNMNRN